MFQNLSWPRLVGILLIFFSMSGTITAQDNILEVTTKLEFLSKVKANSFKTPVVAFFFSKRQCGACNWSLIPMLDKVAKNKNSIILAKIDLDVVDLKEQQEITTVPTTKIYHKGKAVLTPAEGVSWGPIIKLVNQATKLQ